MFRIDSGADIVKDGRISHKSPLIHSQLSRRADIRYVPSRRAAEESELEAADVGGYAEIEKNVRPNKKQWLMNNLYYVESYF